MGSLLLALVMVAVLATVVYGVVVMLSGDDPGLGAAEPDGRALPLPTNRSLTEADLKAVRFDTVLRGYRMAQVDRALRRTAYDLGYKDEMIAVLEAEVIALREGRLEDAELLRKAREAASDTSAAPMPAVSSAPASGRPSPDTHAPDTHAPDTHAPDTHAPDTHAPDTHAPDVASRTSDATRPSPAPDGYEPRHSDLPPVAGVPAGEPLIAGMPLVGGVPLVGGAPLVAGAPPVAHGGQAGAEHRVAGAGAGTSQATVDQLTAGRPATGDRPSAPGDAPSELDHAPSRRDGEQAHRSTRA